MIRMQPPMSEEEKAELEKLARKSAYGNIVYFALSVAAIRACKCHLDSDTTFSTNIFYPFIVCNLLFHREMHDFSSTVPSILLKLGFSTYKWPHLMHQKSCPSIAVNVLTTCSILWIGDRGCGTVMSVAKTQLVLLIQCLLYLIHNWKEYRLCVCTCMS